MCGISGYQVIGPLCIIQNLNDKRCLDMLANATNRLITEAVENHLDRDGNYLLDDV